jgi:hypothetical protein
MSSIDDLRLPSVKVNEVRQFIKEQEQTDYSAYHKQIISAGLSIGTIVMLTVSICLCFCCCKVLQTMLLLVYKNLESKTNIQ